MAIFYSDFFFKETIKMKTRGSKEHMSLTLAYVHIKQRTQKDSWQNCVLVLVMRLWTYFTEQSCCLITIISAYNEIGPEVTVGNILKKLTIVYKIVKIAKNWI